MSPFLPPHRQYDFGPDHSSPLQCSEEIDDCALCPSLLPPPSPLPQFHQDFDTLDEDKEKEILAGKDTSCCDPVSDNRMPLVTNRAGNKHIQPQQRSLSLRKRATVDQVESRNSNSNSSSSSGGVTSTVLKRLQTQSNLKILTTYKKDHTNTISLDRFSACIPCRRRKIKCIPKGDSHHYLSNGTNNGVCATCIRRKKDCFWPKIDIAARTSSSSPAPLQEVLQADVVKEEDKMETCEDEGDKEVAKGETVPIDEVKNDTTISMTKEEDVEATPVRSPLPTTFSERFFGVPMQGFGRAVSTPALSPTSSSSSSSSSPDSPRTDASFLSPNIAESFFFENKSTCQSPPHLDDLHHAMESETLFTDGY